MKPTFQTTKIDANTIEVVKTIPENVLSPTTYDYSFLKQQLVSIQKQKDDYDALRDAELAEVQGLIDEADKLGITEKAVSIEPLPIEKLPPQSTPGETLNP